VRGRNAPAEEVDCTAAVAVLVVGWGRVLWGGPPYWPPPPGHLTTPLRNADVPGGEVAPIVGKGAVTSLVRGRPVGR
jgi:hypothetical protein